MEAAHPDHTRIYLLGEQKPNGQRDEKYLENVAAAFEQKQKSGSLTLIQSQFLAKPSSGNFLTRLEKLNITFNRFDFKIVTRTRSNVEVSTKVLIGCLPMITRQRNSMNSVDEEILFSVTLFQDRV